MLLPKLNLFRQKDTSQIIKAISLESPPVSTGRLYQTTLRFDTIPSLCNFA